MPFANIFDEICFLEFCLRKPPAEVLSLTQEAASISPTAKTTSFDEMLEICLRKPSILGSRREAPHFPANASIFSFGIGCRKFVANHPSANCLILCKGRGDCVSGGEVVRGEMQSCCVKSCSFPSLQSLSLAFTQLLSPSPDAKAGKHMVAAYRLRLLGFVYSQLWARPLTTVLITKAPTDQYVGAFYG